MEARPAPLVVEGNENLIFSGYRGWGHREQKKPLGTEGQYQT